MDIWNYYDGDLKYPDIIDYFYDPNYGKQLSIHNSKIAYEFASTNGKFIEGEPIIAKSPYYSYEYARNILKWKPFKLGEPAIAKDSYYSYMYARFALKEKPFPLGEPVISKDETYSKKYTKEILKKDFILNGKLICKYEE